VDLSRQELENIYLELEKPLFNFALRWVWNRALAQELVQDAFVRIWSHRSRIERSTLKGLLYKTVQNLAINERRKMRLRAITPLLDWFLGNEKPGLEQDFIRQQDLEMVQKALDLLPDEMRETLLMCEFSDMTHEQIGQALNIPAGTVASRRNRGMKLMQEMVKLLEGKPGGK